MSKLKTATKKLKLPVKREFSAGGCVYKKSKIKNQKSKILWLVGKHSGYHKWVLPKGLIEKGEKGIETAVRETREEMGVRAKVVGEKPIHKEEYWFVASLARESHESLVKNKKKPIRRVYVYQEEPSFAQASESTKVRVLKTVSFYLMEYESGEPEDHDWEMSEAGWYGYEEAMGKLAFGGEKKALELAREKLLR